VTRAKICGITRLEDAELAAELGAWAIGLIRWPHSPRACDHDTAAAIVAALRRRVACVGVFVNATLDEIAEHAEAIPLSLIQLHGDEGPSFCTEIARRTGARVIKARAVHSGADLHDVDRFHTDFHLLDAHQEGMRGGTGETFDWQLVAQRHSNVPLILSGGLNHENVADAIAATNPWAVDVASGTEASHGVKDHAKLAAFAAAVREHGDVDERRSGLISSTERRREDGRAGEAGPVS
jgi:phosphoribosylanthranilate isomerase